MEAIAQHTGLTIDWTEEVGWGDFPAALNSHRIDAMCFGAWPKASTAREVMFTKSIYFLPIYAYARADDHRFDDAPQKINDPSVTISAMDSEISSQLAASLFSKARVFSIPQLSDASVLLMNVAAGKADVTFTDSWTAASFNEQNSGKIRQIPMERPFRVFGHTIPVAQGEIELQQFLNIATDEVLASGELDAIIRRYEKSEGVLLHVPPPYNK
jgi:ABC-type amino acid transport substrate-binding protein